MSLEAAKREINRPGRGQSLALDVTLVGWATPDMWTAGRRAKRPEGLRTTRPNGSKVQITLNDQAAKAIGPIPLTGWRSPMSGDGEGGVMEIRPGTTGKYKLRDEAHLAGWPTPVTRDVRSEDIATINARKARGGKNGAPMLCTMVQTVPPVGWPSPTAGGLAGEISPDLERKGGKWVNSKTGRVLQTNLATDAKMLLKLDPGPTSESSIAPTESRGVLASEFSRWLMGYLEAWEQCSPGYLDWLNWQDLMQRR